MSLKWRKKPVVIEAVRVSVALSDASHDWKNLPVWLRESYDRGEIVFGSKEVHITTLEGIMVGGYEDWIIQGVKGELYPCKNDIFRATYDLVDDVLVDVGRVD